MDSGISEVTYIVLSATLNSRSGNFSGVRTTT
jgi:hypothetical protein